MQLLDVVLLAVAVVLLGGLFARPVRASRSWRATVTPLASIIGSGFLVVVPVLGHTLGDGALWAVVLIVGFAYAVGEVMRFNIRHLEPLLVEGSEQGVAQAIRRIDLISSFALAIAYFVSVAFYLRLLSAFVLRGFGSSEPWLADVVTTILLVIIGGVGKARGLSALERLEQYSVSVKLAIIAAMLVGWSVLAAGELSSSESLAVTPPNRDSWQVLRIVAGTFLIVQGFETSRYLGAEYDAVTRIRTMRRAQLVSAVIYIVFVGLSVPSLALLPEQLDETAIIAVAGHVAWVLPAMVIVAAAMSQFSAAVADTVGAGGLLSQSVGRRVLLSARNGYVVVSVVAVVLVWSTDVFAIIALASRAFALYYALQAVGAAVTAGHLLRGGRRTISVAAFAIIAAALMFVVVFALPAD